MSPEQHIGQLLPFRHSMWRIRSITDRDPKWLLELEHIRGPLEALGIKTRTLALGETVIHIGVNKERLQAMTEPFPVCSCHGHPWPCTVMRDAKNAERATERWMKLYDLSAASVCNSCGEAITSRQRSITFPEPWLQLADAPPPEYHTRINCWLAAQRYEEEYRLKHYPQADRLVSCSGMEFVHTNFTECSAEQLCTGLHGPPTHRNYEDTNCQTLTIDANVAYQARYKCPSPDCRGTQTWPSRPTASKPRYSLLTPLPIPRPYDV